MGGRAAATAGVLYLTLSTVAVAISVGVVLCFAFVAMLILLHRALWLAVLSAVPGLFFLVGSAQYAPAHRGRHNHPGPRRDPHLGGQPLRPNSRSSAFPPCGCPRCRTPR